MKYLLIFLLPFKGFFSTKKTPKMLYPNITFSINVYDEETKENIENVKVFREMYYEYVDCQIDGGTLTALNISKALLHDENISQKRREKYKLEIPELKKLHQQELKLNKTVHIDSLFYTKPMIFTEIEPFKSYSITISHPEYETVKLSKSWEVCSFEIYLGVGMKRK